MADEGADVDSAGYGGNGAGEDEAQIQVITQYVKDLSFENPRAPASLVQSDVQPHGDVSIQVRTRGIGGEGYEIVIDLVVNARQDEEVAFVVELTYGGVFRVSGFDEDLADIALMVECPRILFPFARRIVADVVRDGGFPPLLLAPVDFLKLYQQRVAEEDDDEGETGEGEAAGA